MLQKGPKNVTDLPLWIVCSKGTGPHYSCSSNGTTHNNLLILKGHFKSLSRINTAPVPIGLNIDVHT
jgi:hypothetical protein